MKRIMTLIVLLSVFALAGCTKEVEVPVEVIKEVEVPVEVIKEVVAEPIEIPAEVNMSNIDLFIERENVQLVDLRNYSDKMSSGYISGFEIISFFEYLEKQAIVRNNGWTWQEDNIVDGDILRNYFDQDADAIFLMCGSGTRAGFVKSALEQLGYTNVYNVGGIADYSGMYKILGGLEANQLKFEAEMFSFGHWTPKRTLTSAAYITFEAELLGFTRYQVVYTSCT